MLIGRGTRRVIGIVTLVAVCGFFGVTAVFLPLQHLWSALGAARWPLTAMVAMVVVGAGYRLFPASGVPVTPPAKPRPTHLRIVRTDETLH